MLLWSRLDRAGYGSRWGILRLLAPFLRGEHARFVCNAQYSIISMQSPSDMLRSSVAPPFYVADCASRGEKKEGEKMAAHHWNLSPIKRAIPTVNRHGIVRPLNLILHTFPLSIFPFPSFITFNLSPRQLDKKGAKQTGTQWEHRQWDWPCASVFPLIPPPSITHPLISMSLARDGIETDVISIDNHILWVWNATLWWDRSDSLVMGNTHSVNSFTFSIGGNITLDWPFQLPFTPTRSNLSHFYRELAIWKGRGGLWVYLP